MAVDIVNIIKEWWDSYQVDPRASFDNIVSGMRKPQVSDSDEVTYDGGVVQPISKSQRQTGACQYWINGLSAQCSNWDFKTLSCKIAPKEGELLPTGYGTGKCDMLGRRKWCSKYIPSKEDDLNEFVCVAVCPELSGLGKQISGVTDSVAFRPFLPIEIKGYNESDTGVGRCDGWGLGRGNQREEYDNIEQLYKDGPICKHYRPQQMGFGAIQPHPFHGSIVAGRPFDPSKNTIPDTIEGVYDKSNADPLAILDKRLPFVFQIYNARAMYQKCSHWKSIKPSFFTMSSESDVSLQSIALDDGVYCECSDSACDPYRTEMTVWPAGVPWITWEVTAKYGGVICNGAKPECPCYTGRWIYCTDNNMREGMRVTADQILELRFWTSNWTSQEEYDSYYMSKPGRTFDGYSDVSTSSIYTFTHWQKLDVNDPNNSVMMGYKHSMCMPAPMHMREFIPSMYVSKNRVIYPKINSNTGTSSSSQVAFPTLVRELESIDLYTPDISVMYPYYTIDPWEIEICQQEDMADFCIHDSSLMSDPYISVIGCTAPDCELYVINKTLIGKDKAVIKAYAYIDKYIKVNQIVDIDIRHDFNDKISKLLSYAESQLEGFTYSTTDDKGLFVVENVKLKTNSSNELCVICKYNSSPFPEYTFRKLKVQSVYWGALITQSSMTHTHFSTGSNAYPKHVEPGATIEGSVSSTRGSVSKIFPIYHHYHRALFGEKLYYGYCINEYEIEDLDIEHWSQIGSTGYIWAEIDNIEISYLLEFEIVDAYLQLRDDNEGDKKKTKVNLCGEDASQKGGVKIPLSKVSIPRRSIPPNAILLKASKPMGFFNDDWKLYIKYKYRALETKKVNPIWPQGMDVEFGSVFFRPSPYKVEYAPGQNVFFIRNAASPITKATLAVMAFVVDDKGRVQTAAATKMLIQGYNQGNKNIEIEYIYAATSQSYKLVPEQGFATSRGAPQAIGVEKGGGNGHYMRAYCGDHQCDTNNCIGPMWYPFENCTKFAFYDFYTPAAQCYLYINEGEAEVKKMGLAAWRYGVAPEYSCWVTEGGNWAATCGASWFYYYSRADMSGMRFVGTVKAKATWGDLSSFEEMGWEPPPFGAANRSYIDRYVSKDFFSFISFAGILPKSDSSYMPVVFTPEDLVVNLDCFSGDQFTGGAINYFSMLSNYTAGFAGESVSTNRYRFSDIILPILHDGCTYPTPSVQIGENYYVIRYGFKHEDHVWAWPEYWKPLERNIESSNGRFNFLNLVLPSYYIDYAKMEHRFVTDEGIHTIVFTPPKGGDDNSGGMKVYPSICLGGEYPRYFDINYSNYESTNNVAWKDESSTGEVGSSDGKNIYEAANNGVGSLSGNIKWLHSYDTLFDDNSKGTPIEDNMFYLGQDENTKINSFGYYNRGLIANIPVSRLKFLPMELSNAGSASASKESDEERILYWVLEGIFGVAPVEINISGFYGVRLSSEGVADIFDKPSINVVESNKEAKFSGDVVPDWPEDSSIGYSSYVDGLSLTDLKKYDIVFELDRKPSRFIQNLSYFMIRLSSLSGHKLFITSISVKTGRYVKAEESVRVWERKYYAGVANISCPNADGPGTVLYRTSDRTGSNSGQFFPMTPVGNKNNYEGLPIEKYTNNGDYENGTGDIVWASVVNGALVQSLYEDGMTISKVNINKRTSASNEDEIIEANMDNLKDIERDAQKDLFEEATSLDDHDELHFSPITHPLLDGWFAHIGGGLKKHKPMILQYNKILWDNSKYPKWLRQEGDFWQPGGHYFEWSDTFMRTKCYSIGPVQDVYSVEFVHYKHAGNEDTMDAGHAYAGYGRVQYAESKYWVSQALKLENQNDTPDLLTGARNGIMGGNG